MLVTARAHKQSASVLPHDVIIVRSIRLIASSAVEVFPLDVLIEVCRRRRRRCRRSVRIRRSNRCRRRLDVVSDRLRRLDFVGCRLPDGCPPARLGQRLLLVCRRTKGTAQQLQCLLLEAGNGTHASLMPLAACRPAFSVLTACLQTLQERDYDN